MRDPPGASHTALLAFVAAPPPAPVLRMDVVLAELLGWDVQGIMEPPSRQQPQIPATVPLRFPAGGVAYASTFRCGGHA